MTSFNNHLNQKSRHKAKNSRVYFRLLSLSGESFFWKSKGFILLLAIILSGCNGSIFNVKQERVNCATITEDLKFARSQLSNSPDTVLKNVIEYYKLDATLSEGWSGRAIYWEQNGNEYAAVLAMNPEKIQRIEVRWNETGPLGSTVLNCLNSPQFYRARIEQEAEAAGVYFELWYINEGMIISRSGFTSADASLSQRPIPSMYFTKAIIVDSNDPDIMQDLAFDSPYIMISSSSLMELKKFSDFLKPWESWENIEFDGDTRLLR